MGILMLKDIQQPAAFKAYDAVNAYELLITPVNPLPLPWNEPLADPLNEPLNVPIGTPVDQSTIAFPEVSFKVLSFQRIEATAESSVNLLSSNELM